MLRPLVLVSSDVRNLDGYAWHAAIDTYLLSAFRAADVTPLILPSFGADVIDNRLLASVQGVLLTGSRSNVHPSRYGVEPTDKHTPFDDKRDATTFALIEAALEHGIPLLAICRGHQELNVALGGTLDAEVQEFDGRMDHRGAPSDAEIAHRFRRNHAIHLTPGGTLRGILGVDSVMVNSVHRQAIGTLSPGLTVEATADDGTVEAVTVTDAKGFTLGVQWHPEYWTNKGLDEDPPSTKIFQAFGQAARAYAG